MRHMFAQFVIAFITGAMSAQLFREYLQQLTERDGRSLHFSMDNEVMSHPAIDATGNRLCDGFRTGLYDV